MIAEKFQIYNVKTVNTANTALRLQIHLWVKKSVQFYSCPQAKPRFLSLSPDRRELPIPPEQHFLKKFFPEQKAVGKDYVVEKITKINKSIGHKFW